MPMPIVSRCTSCLLALGALAAGEIGPSAVAVVYNAESWSSRSVAQAWIRLRGLDDEQAIGLRGLPFGEDMAIEDLRRRILQPVEDALTARGLAARIQVIAYGPDLPLNLRFTGGPAQIGRYGPAALTGMTLLAPLLGQGPAVYTGPNANPYAEQIDVPGAELDRRAAADPRSDAAMARFTAKDPAGAEAVLRPLAAELPAMSVLYNLACAQSLLGRPADAMASLAGAVQAGWFNADLTISDSDLAGLHGLPEWPALIAAMRTRADAIRPQPSLAFSQLPAVDGIPGRLAMVLAVCSGRGVAVDEAMAGLAASAAADASHPAGTVWFMRSSDQARTGPRAWSFPAAVRALAEVGIDAKAADGALPPAGATAIGVMAGIADYDWKRSGASILPGAWCDNLTSFAGAMQPHAGQTPLSAWLRAGAAGSGGAVGEPWAFPSKFPTAFVHLHRVRGLSLVEAVHRTLPQPFQYLAVGDPLSRPWAAAGLAPSPTPTTRLGWIDGLPIDVATTGIVRVHHLGRVLAEQVAVDGAVRLTIAGRDLGIGPQRLLVRAADGRVLRTIDVDVLPPAILPALPAPAPTVDGARGPEGRVLATATEGAWADAIVPQGGEVEGWIEAGESGLHQLAWSSARLRSVAWDGGPALPVSSAGGDPVVLARGWHRLRLDLAAGPAPLELRFGRHGARPLEAKAWRHLP